MFKFLKMRFPWQAVWPFIDRLAFRKGWEEFTHCFQMGFSGESQIFTSKSWRKVFIVLSLSLNMMIWRDNIGSNMSQQHQCSTCHPWNTYLTRRVVVCPYFWEGRRLLSKGSHRQKHCKSSKIFMCLWCAKDKGLFGCRLLCVQCTLHVFLENWNSLFVL